ncbi:HAD family phosphatase [Nocardia panacis]|uniref:HAD family phosphatase n=1 Tax=Nocardia panacis TaxID=2340916 RepID=A0A3A4JYF2_9NOCA|nr:HAD family phosphatase [Nocardia panacis]RJO68203.1 HAD family phosphatase [Nocardia panacis]
MGARLGAVLWDMDGTLLDSEKLWDLAVRELAREFDREMTDEIRHALIGSSVENSLRIIFTGLDIEPTPAAFDRCAAFLDRRMVELMSGPIPWRPGAKDALALVREAGLSTALVTNTKRAFTEYGLDTLGREYFDVTVCGDEVPRGKPAPDGYLRAAEFVGVAPESCVAVEDSPTGAAAAQAAGCAVIVIPCEIPVPAAPGRTFRESLVGLTIDDLRVALDGL